jgi:hypothetical protein
MRQNIMVEECRVSALLISRWPGNREGEMGRRGQGQDIATKHPLLNNLFPLGRPHPLKFPPSPKTAPSFRDQDFNT